MVAQEALNFKVVGSNPTGGIFPDSMSHYDTHQKFHVGLKAFIESDGKLLILKDTDGLWELPGGRVDKNDREKSLRETLLREVKEELGEEVSIEVNNCFHTWSRRPHPDRDYYILLVGFKCSYIDGKIRLSDEHTDMKWVNKEEIAKLDFENTYKEAVTEFFKLRTVSSAG